MTSAPARTTLTRTILPGFGLAALAACGGGSDGGTPTGTLSVGLTDGPVDAAEHVWIQFTGLELKASGGPAESYPFEPDACDVYDAALETCTIDLLALQGVEQRTFFEHELPVGDYEWIRLMVNAEQNVADSYVEFEGPVVCPLWIPSGAQTGLKLPGPLTVTTNGSRYMLDLDLGKSIHQPPGLEGDPDPAACVENYLMRPVVRIIDETEAGSIAGVVDQSVLEDGPGAPFPGCEINGEGFIDDLKIYVFEDFADQPAAAVLDDYDDDAGDPVASAFVDYDVGSMTYSYEVGYLLTGGYRLGLACNANLDDPATDDFDGGVQGLGECGSAADPAFCFLADRAIDVDIGVLNDGGFPAAP